MPTFKTDATLIFLYYRDLNAACAFYADVLGLTLAADQGFCKIYQITPHSFVGLVDGARGTHQASDTKPVILSFVTDELDAWHAHLVARNVRIFRPLGTSEAIGVRGFMALDPEGYVLEFEQFIEADRNVTIRHMLGK